jgi:phosphohistidine phosphatase
MSKELWLLRHAKSDRNAKTEDISRPLKKRGKRDAKNMGVWLREQDLSPDVILCSPAKRAFDTANFIFNGDDIEDERMIVLNENLYESSIETLKSVLASYEETVQTILLIGHNPEFENFLVHLLGGDALPSTEKLFPTCTLFRLSLDHAWKDLQPNSAKLVSVTYPRSID